MAACVRSFEEDYDLFWCQSYNEYAIYGMIYLFNIFVLVWLGFECKESVGGCRTMK